MKIISCYDNPNRLVLSGPASPGAAAWPASGAASKLLGIWRLGESLHRGAHSQLWSAQPADSAGSPRWDYVLKTVPRQRTGSADREPSLARLRCFFEAASVARHPHLVAVVDAAIDGAEPFLVMPRLTGRSLAAVLANGAGQPLAVVLWFIRQTAAACTALHQTGWVHSDIKPENVFVSPQGDVTLMDLGLACPVGRSSDCAVGGSATYAAPERLQSDLPVTASSDVFSLGRLLWQLLSLVDKDQTAPGSIEAVADLITDAVHPDPADRPTAEQFMSRLMRLETKTLGQHIRPTERVMNSRAA